MNVWEEMGSLGELVREPKYFNDVYSVARETMRRVKQKIEDVINEVEITYGFFSLSLRAFYQEVGSENFMLSFRQIAHYYRPERDEDSGLLIMVEEDP